MSAVGLVGPGDHLFWLGVCSALGIVALLLVSVSVGFGLALSARLGQRPGSASRFRVLHEAVALVSLVAIAGHGLLLLGDHFLHPTFAQVTVPFLLETNRLWTGTGVIAGWLAAIITLSFYVRRIISASAVWRWLHRWTPLVVYLPSESFTRSAPAPTRARPG